MINPKFKALNYKQIGINSNHEILNTKQIQNTNDQISNNKNKQF